jgi:transposase
LAQKFTPPPTPCGENATMEELREENKRLRMELRRADREREILGRRTSFASFNPPRGFTR